jgi:UDP-3-O-[3-hydroxymyristoyl] glucosamine N-acyltransferase
MVNKRFFTKENELSIAEILELTQSKLENNAKIDSKISDIATLDAANIGDLSFFDNPKYLDDFKNSKAEFCFIHSKHLDQAPSNMTVLITDNPYKAYAIIASKLYTNTQQNKNHIANTAIIGANSNIGTNCIIGDYVVIGDDVEIGNNVCISSHVAIGDKCVIGDDTIIYSQVTISYSSIGKRAIIHPGARIGQDGFGFAVNIKIPQLGGVIIGDDVEIGANTTIDRGAGPDTIIGNMTKIDNLVQIAHNVQIGEGCFIVSQVGISGSTKIGDYVVLGGQVGVSGHLEIGSNIQVAAKSGVQKNLPSNQIYGGFPIVPINEWRRQSVALKNLIKKK